MKKKVIIVMLNAYIALGFIIVSVWLFVQYLYDLADGCLVAGEAIALPLGILGILAIAGFPILAIAGYVDNDSQNTGNYQNLSDRK